MAETRRPDQSGTELHDCVRRLFPICRSLTGNGVRETLRILQETLPSLRIHEVPTGTKAFDWEVPREWSIEDAYLEDEAGNRVVDFRKNNLHVVSYSVPVDATLTLEELEPHLHSLPEQPGAIPYLTSYYQERWGFCLAHEQRRKLKPGKYRAVIRSKLEAGHLTYADCVIPGETKEEILLSSYVCHPSMANNELSGPVVTAFLGKWLASRRNRFTYRIVLAPETIGAIVYLSRHHEEMKKRTRAGFQITCVGDERAYSYIPSRRGATLSDRVALHVLSHRAGKFDRYSFLDRGSDERQYCSPGIDLPVASICRSKYSSYPEYHTSLDNLDFVTPAGLEGAFRALRDCLEILEGNLRYRSAIPCEPQLSRRGLRPSLGAQKILPTEARRISNLLAYADGESDLLAIAETIGEYALDLLPLASRLESEGLLQRV